MEEQFTMIAKTVQGLEEVLSGELKALGAEEVEILNRAVLFTGDTRIMYKANYLCRTALRILVPWEKVTVRSEEDMYHRIKALDWLSIFDVDQTFAIDTVLNTPHFTHSHYVSQLAKDAIADHFRERTGRRPSVDIDRPDFRINLHVYLDQCDVSLDSSGYSLHKRGYRVMTHDAPLSEVLAAGMIMLSGWDQASHFIDPMCGSGTLLIEALMLSLNVPAASFRPDFGFLHWNDFDATLWESVKEEAAAARKQQIEFKVIGNDRSKKSLYQASQNLEQAGLLEYAELVQGDFKKLIPPSAPGTIITNPPYGERMTVENINLLYQDLGNLFKRSCAGYSAWVLSSDIQALKLIGLKPKRKIHLFNGPLECRMFGFDLYEGSKYGLDTNEVGHEDG